MKSECIKNMITVHAEKINQTSMIGLKKEFCDINNFSPTLIIVESAENFIGTGELESRGKEKTVSLKRARNTPVVMRRRCSVERGSTPDNHLCLTSSEKKNLCPDQAQVLEQRREEAELQERSAQTTPPVAASVHLSRTQSLMR